MGFDTALMDLISTENYIALYVAAVALLAGVIYLFNRYLPKPDAR